MPHIQRLDFQNVVLSIDNSMSKIVVFVCPQLYMVLTIDFTDHHRQFLIAWPFTDIHNFHWWLSHPASASAIMIILVAFSSHSHACPQLETSVVLLAVPPVSHITPLASQVSFPQWHGSTGEATCLSFQRTKQPGEENESIGEDKVNRDQRFTESLHYQDLTIRTRWVMSCFEPWLLSALEDLASMLVSLSVFVKLAHTTS